LKSVKVGSVRVDIDGNEAAEIDQVQADYASKTLKESQEKFGNNKPKENNTKKQYKDRKPAKDQNAKPDQKAKFKAVKSTKRSSVKTEVKLQPVSAESIIVGKKVKVQLSNSPMNATITEVSGKDITVQLDSGMIVKTQVKNIFTE